LLAAYGIQTPPLRLANSAEDAAQLAQAMGYPVALKITSPDIAHKSDVDGVLLGLPDATAVRKGFETILANSRRARPKAHLEGVQVQRMLPAGQDVIVGAVQDPQFGALVMFGSGGVEVEGLKDVAFALAPLPLAEAEEIVDSTWAGRKLRGFRHLPTADRTAALQAVLRLGQLAADLPAIAEIEINPLRVLPDGEGAYALDVRAKLSNY
jgi:acetyltransferase